jgi:hypothetical protein
MTAPVAISRLDCRANGVPTPGFAFGDFERPEASAEGDLLFVVEALIVEHQDRMLVESGTDSGEGFVVHRRARIDPAKLGAEQRMQFHYRDRHSDLLAAGPVSITANGSNI